MGRSHSMHVHTQIIFEQTTGTQCKTIPDVSLFGFYPIPKNSKHSNFVMREGCDRRNIVMLRCVWSLNHAWASMRFDVTWYINGFLTFVDVDSIQSMHHICHTLYLCYTRMPHVQKQVVKQKRLYSFKASILVCTRVVSLLCREPNSGFTQDWCKDTFEIN